MWVERIYLFIISKNIKIVFDLMTNIGIANNLTAKFCTKIAVKYALIGNKTNAIQNKTND